MGHQDGVGMGAAWREWGGLVAVAGLALGCAPSIQGVGDGDAKESGADGAADGADGAADGADGAVDGGGDGAADGAGDGSTTPSPDPELEVVPARALTFHPPGGTFVGAVEVDLAGGEGAVVRYTTDRSAPDDDALAWPGPTRITSATTICASVDGVPEVRCETYLPLLSDVSDFDSNLPLLILHAEGWAPERDDDGVVPISVTLLEPGDGGRAPLLGTAALSTRGGLRVRGSSSSDFPKRPYALELWEGASQDDRREAILGMPADGDWVLYAPFAFDQSMMRNSLIYELSNEVGRYAPRTRFVEVFVTERGRAVSAGDYVGLYVLTERIERGDERVAVTELAEGDLTTPSVTGGYVFKYDRLGDGDRGFSAGDAGGTFSLTEPFVFVDPDEDVIADEQADYLADAVDSIGDALADPDGLDPRTGAHWSALIDVDSFIDHHILNTFPKNPDAFRLSGYFHKDREGPVVAGPIWDFDRAMGSNWDDRSQDPTWWDATNYTPDNTYVFEFGWYPALFADEGFREAWWDRYRTLLDGPLSPTELSARVDAYAVELAEAGPRDLARWPDYPARGTWNDEVELMRAWLIARHAWISACVDRRPDDPRSCAGGAGLAPAR